jgi:tetratricopeptide (TPR) repeat protein
MILMDDLSDQILTDGPSSGTLFVILSKLKETGQIKRVIKECIRALRYHPGDIPIRQLLAESYLEMGWLSLAEVEIELATRQLDHLIPAYKLKAHIYHAEKREAEASEALRLYLAHRPDDGEALALLEKVKPSEETLIDVPQPIVEEAPAPVRTVTEEAPEPVELAALPEIATPTLAEVYFSQGQIQEAIHTYEKVVAQNPGAEQFRHRLEALKTMISPVSLMREDEEALRAREKRERLITHLETWRAQLRRMSKEAAPL